MNLLPDKTYKDETAASTATMANIQPTNSEDSD